MQFQLEDCQFRGADLASSTFSRVISRTKSLVRIAIKNSNFEHANLRGLCLQNLQAEQVRFSQAAMEECDLSEAAMLECDLGGAELLSAVLTLANLSGSNLSGMDLRQLKAYDGMIILDHQQIQLLQEMGIEVL